MSQQICAFLFGMTVLDLKDCQTILTLYFFHKLHLFFFKLCIFTVEFLLQEWFSGGLYGKTAHNCELKLPAPSSLPCSIFCCDACLYPGKHAIRMHKNYATAGLFPGTVIWVIPLKTHCMTLICLAVNDLSINFNVFGVSWTSVGIQI